MNSFLAIALLIGPALVQPTPPAPSAPPPAPPSPAAAAPPTAPVDAWRERLTKLDPARPLDYFLLGEEVAAESDAPSRTLAQQLFVLAYHLDAGTKPGAAGGTGAPGTRSSLGPSVCLALASIATREDEKRWLIALADTLSDRPNSSISFSISAAPAETAFDLATAMGLARAGEGRRAEQLLEKPGVDELLTRMDAVPLSDGGSAGLRTFLKRIIRDWPVCTQCRGRRAIPAGQNRSGEMVICDTCRGNPGPKLTDLELSAQLRIEAILLQGALRSWAAQSLSDNGAPLRDLDPSELAGTYRVDPAKPLWRDGQWVPVPDSPAAATPTPAPPKPE